MRKAFASGLRSLARSNPGAPNDKDDSAQPSPEMETAFVDADDPVLVDAEGTPCYKLQAQSSSPPAAKEDDQQPGSDGPKKGKAIECCALCTEAFTPWGSSLSLGSLVRKAPPRRNKHSCRVCARPVCETDSSDVAGCCRKARVPKRLWHRSLASLRKEDSKVRLLDCKVCERSYSAVQPADEAGTNAAIDAASKSDKDVAGEADLGSCSCAEGWLCSDCEAHVSEYALETTLDDLAQAASEGMLDRLHASVQKPIISWLLSLDCDETEDARHFAGLSQRLLRAADYVERGIEPKWPRPATKPRCFKSQVGYSALEAFNFMAGGKIRMAVQGVRLAARGYAFSEYILSEEFIIAWRLLFDQLGEFVDDSGSVLSSLPAVQASGATETPKDLTGGRAAACEDQEAPGAEVSPSLPPSIPPSLPAPSPPLSLACCNEACRHR
jgi:hypothetical protein